MKLFGTVFPFIETGDQKLLFGRRVANFEFLKALLEFGSFNEYHLFCLNPSHARHTRDLLLAADLDPKAKEKVKLFLYSDLIKQISTKSYHVFHLGGWGYFFPGLIYLRNRHAKEIFPVTGVIHSLNGMETPYHALKLLLSPHLQCDAVICTSNSGREVLKKTFDSIHILQQVNPCRLQMPLIPLGYDNRRFRMQKKADCRMRLGLLQDQVIVLSVGRFAPTSKADLFPLLQQFANASKKTEKKLLLFLAGGGQPSGTDLVRSMATDLGIGDSVNILTNFDEDRKPDLYGASDIYVSLSDNLQETFGLSVIEAMGCGLPVVVSDFDGYKELVNHGKTGFKIPTLRTPALNFGELSDIMNFDTMQMILSQGVALDNSTLCETLINLANSPELRRQIGTEASILAKEKFCWQRVISQYDDLWNSLYEQSKKITGKVSPENPLANDYFETFSHYPTRVIDDHNFVSLTDYGRSVLLKESLPASYEDISMYLDRELAITACKSLVDKDLSVAEILSRFPEKDCDCFWVTLLWMAKYDLVRITSEKPS